MTEAYAGPTGPRPTRLRGGDENSLNEAKSTPSAAIGAGGPETRRRHGVRRTRIAGSGAPTPHRGAPITRNPRHAMVRVKYSRGGGRTFPHSLRHWHDCLSARGTFPHLSFFCNPSPRCLPPHGLSSSAVLFIGGSMSSWSERFPLSAAACCADASALRHLLYGADGSSGPPPKSTLDSLDEEGRCALHYSAWNGLLDTTLMLLHAGASIDCLTGDRRSTAMHFAAGMGHAHVVAALLQHNGDPKLLDCDKWSPRDLARQNLFSKSAAEIEEIVSLLDAGVEQICSGDGDGSACCSRSAWRRSSGLAAPNVLST